MRLTSKNLALLLFKALTASCLCTYNRSVHSSFQMSFSKMLLCSAKNILIFKFKADILDFFHSQLFLVLFLTRSVSQFLQTYCCFIMRALNMSTRKLWIILKVMRFYVPLNMGICDILEIHNIPRNMLEPSSHSFCPSQNYRWSFKSLLPVPLWRGTERWNSQHKATC